ncbi:hypothetical protein JOM56_011964 [Amanita muscaria]
MRDIIKMSASPTLYPCTPKRPTAPRYTYCTPSPPTCTQRSSDSKTRIPSSPLNVKTPVRRGQTRRVSMSDSLVFTDPRTPQTPRADDPLKTILRQKFQVRCLERAARARAEQVKRRRYVSTPSEASSDGFDETMDDDVEEDDDAVMQDELFRRIVASSTRKDRHSYRVSYALEVGSSFDPGMEDAAKWEDELRACPTSGSNEFLSSEITTQLPPFEEDEDEVAAYAEHFAALAEFEDIPDDELFSWSDFEDGEEDRPAPPSSSLMTEKAPAQPEPEEDAMCIA